MFVPQYEKACHRDAKGDDRGADIDVCSRPDPWVRAEGCFATIVSVILRNSFERSRTEKIQAALARGIRRSNDLRPFSETHSKWQMQADLRLVEAQSSQQFDLALGAVIREPCRPDRLVDEPKLKAKVRTWIWWSAGIRKSRFRKAIAESRRI